MPFKTNNDSWLRELAFTGRVFDYKEAIRMGFLSGAFETKEKMIEKMLEDAKFICTKSPVGIWANKHVFFFFFFVKII